VFEITAAGKLTTLNSFDGSDGCLPYAGLVQATGGNFYGRTFGGGASSACRGYFCGTVFVITSRIASGPVRSIESNRSLV
jgi:hypothetical protein